MTRFEVIDLRSDVLTPRSHFVEAYTPEGAAELALGEKLVRGRPGKDVKARVYWQMPGQSKNMVRLYADRGSTK